MIATFGRWIILLYPIDGQVSLEVIEYVIEYSSAHSCIASPVFQLAREHVKYNLKLPPSLWATAQWKVLTIEILRLWVQITFPLKKINN